MAPRTGCHEVLPANVLSPCTSPMTTREQKQRSRAPVQCCPTGRREQNLQVDRFGPPQEFLNYVRVIRRVPPPVLKCPHCSGWRTAGKHPIHVVDFSGT